MAAAHSPPQLFFQSVTATRWDPFTTDVMEQASASAKTAPQGQNVTSACRDTTGSKAVTVSTGRVHV